MTLKSYALSVVAIVIISQIGDMLLPSGRMKNSVKVVFSVIIVLVFATPILKIAQGSSDIESLIDNIEVNSVKIDESYISYVSTSRNEIYENYVENALIGNLGVSGVKVSVTTESSDGAIAIKNVIVDLSNAVLSGNEEHINMNEVRQVVAAALSIDEEKVTIIE